ncbi:hypothetical protein ACVFYP_20010 [Roseomonas sp. F4]
MTAAASTADLVRRVADVELAYTLSRMAVLERLPGNPMGIAVRRERQVVALMARQIPSPSFNRILGLGGADAALVAPLLDWYRAAGASPRIVVEPMAHGPELARELILRGFLPAGFHAGLVGMSGPGGDEAGIEAIAGPEAMERFLDTYLAAWGFPAAHRDGFRANVRGWLGEPGWSLYLAQQDGTPAAVGTLYLRDGIGYCADAATMPEQRDRGLHMRLLARRRADAFAAGAGLVCGGADYLSGSHRNMERAGMRLLTLRSILAAG